MKYIDYVKHYKHKNDINCSHHNIKLKDVLDSPEVKWDCNYLSSNKNITINDVLNNPQINWNWDNLSLYANISVNDLLDHPNFEWDYTYLSANKNLTIDFLLAFPDKEWCWFHSSSVIPLEDIKNHPELPWDYTAMSLNKTLNIDFLIDNIDEDWNWSFISCSLKNITIKDVLFYHIKWKYEQLSQNSSIKYKDIISNMNIKWNQTYTLMQYNKSLSFDELLKLNPYSIYLLRNVSVTIDDILKYHIDYLTFAEICRKNYNITIDDILKNPQLKWDWYHLSKNEMIKKEDVIKYSKGDVNLNIEYEEKEMFEDYLYSEYYKRKLINQFLKCERQMILKCFHPCREIILAEN